MEVDTLSYNSQKCNRNKRQVVDEKLFRLTVNGQALVNLVASPYHPEQLVTGFLFLQGLIAAIDDVVTLGICRDSGQVAVTVRGEIPERLSPTLTSGCGGGISFDNLDALSITSSMQTKSVYSPEFIVGAMSELFDVSKQYAEHGGIHSAALCDEGGLLFHAEDIGRHNTIDRIAGESLQRGANTAGKLLLTSGRVSSEMAIKAVRLGVAALASRTSPTSMAVEICEKQNIGLAGYVRAGKMEIYASRDCFGI